MLSQGCKSQLHIRTWIKCSQTLQQSFLQFVCILQQMFQVQECGWGGWVHACNTFTSLLHLHWGEGGGGHQKRGMGRLEPQDPPLDLPLYSMPLCSGDLMSAKEREAAGLHRYPDDALWPGLEAIGQLPTCIGPEMTTGQMGVVKAGHRQWTC